MDVRRSVQARMTDPNAQVREATIELLGKFIVARPDLIQDYYNIIIERIKVRNGLRFKILSVKQMICLGFWNVSEKEDHSNHERIL